MPVDCDLEFAKSRYQSARVRREESDARREEVRIWEENRAKQWFWERHAENKKMDDPNVMMELLYYCPTMKTTCFIYDFREYHRIILGLRYKIKGIPETVPRCRCRTRIADFKRCLPSMEYRKRFGEITVRRLEQVEKKK